MPSAKPKKYWNSHFIVQATIGLNSEIVNEQQQ